MRIQVKDFMSTPVITAVAENKVSETMALMKEKGIHAVPIISYPRDNPEAEMTIQGIFTTSDISEEVNKNTTVQDEMTNSNVHVVHVNSSANSAAKMMLKHEVHYIVVMDDGKIKGMISAMDFVKLVTEYTLD